MDTSRFSRYPDTIEGRIQWQNDTEKLIRDGYTHIDGNTIAVLNDLLMPYGISIVAELIDHGGVLDTYVRIVKEQA